MNTIKAGKWFRFVSLDDGENLGFWWFGFVDRSIGYRYRLFLLRVLRNACKELD